MEAHMSKQIEQNPSRISLNPKGIDVAELDDLADDLDSSRADLLRQFIQEGMERYEARDEDHETEPPAEPKLRRAYLRLVEIAEETLDGCGLRVPLADAENKLYTSDTPKDSVRRSLIKPLKRRGYCRIDSTVDEVWVVVRPLDPEGDRYREAER